MNGPLLDLRIQIYPTVNRLVIHTAKSVCVSGARPASGVNVSWPSHQHKQVG